jgi:hypothetical protein
MYGRVKKIYSFLTGKPEEEGKCGRPRRRWDYKIKLDLRKETGRSWSGLTWLRIDKSSSLL